MLPRNKKMRHDVKLLYDVVGDTNIQVQLRFAARQGPRSARTLCARRYYKLTSRGIKPTCKGHQGLGHAVLLCCHAVLLVLC